MWLQLITSLSHGKNGQPLIYLARFPAFMRHSSDDQNMFPLKNQLYFFIVAEINEYHSLVPESRVQPQVNAKPSNAGLQNRRILCIWNIWRDIILSLFLPIWFFNRIIYMYTVPNHKSISDFRVALQHLTLL